MNETPRFTDDEWEALAAGPAAAAAAIIGSSHLQEAPAVHWCDSS